MSEMLDLVQGVLSKLIALLPQSPFKDFFTTVDKIPYIEYINWFIPIGKMLTLGSAWLSAVGTFYLLSVVLRWVRAIE